ncbi:MAG TPA: host attachment protein [Hyphomicrobiaceae bacterium]|nr:host attachment protein [Hyphomicrobiaceae bacterium]
MKPDRTWIVIADGAHAKVFEHTADNPKLEPVNGVGFATRLPPTREIVTDRLVRSIESQGHARHAKTERSDPHRELKRASAERLAGILKSKLAQKCYERLVLVAPPVTLGDLREALPKGVRARVIGELAQDLVKTPQSQLRRHLRDVLPEKPARAAKPQRRTAAPKGSSKK